MLISALKVTNPTEMPPYEADFTTHMKIRHKIYANDPYEEFIVDGEEKVPLTETDLGLLQHPRWSSLCDNSYRLEAVNYYHKVLRLGCCSSPRSAFKSLLQMYLEERSKKKSTYTLLNLRISFLQSRL